MKIGSLDITDLKIGTTEINEVRIGSTLVWERSSYVYLVDVYSPVAAYSLRKLSSTATLAIRVRRSSDNAETDIGFIGNDLDTATLLSFVGAGNGFIAKQYNQGVLGGTADISQTASVSQPRIVNAGVLDTRGSKPAINFDGVNDTLNNFSSAFLNIVSMSYFSVSNNDVSDNAGIIHSQYSINNNTIRTFCDRRNAFKRHLAVVSTFSDMSTFRNSADQRLLSSFIDAAYNMSSFDNGATGTTATGAVVGNNGLNLGSQTTLSYLNGTIQEFIAFNSYQSANRIAIESNINDYYGIY